MKKMRRISGFVMTLVLGILLAGTGAQAAFRDVAPGDWYYESVTKFVDMGILSGYADGTFRPEGTVTHAEFISMLVRAVHEETIASKPGEHWASGYIEKAYETGMIFSDTEKAADSPLSRDMAARYLVMTAVNVLEEEDISTAGIPEMITDNSGYSYYVRQAYGRGLIGGYPDGSFRPDGTLTRSEAAALVLRLLEPKERLAVNVVFADDYFSGGMEAGGYTISLGMKIEDLIKQAGQPDEVLLSDYDLKWYLYGTQDYKNFFMAEAIPSGEIIRIYAAGKNYTAKETMQNTVHRYTDKHGGGNEYAALVTIKEVTGLGTGGGEQMGKRSEENGRLSFHISNAFRVFHGLNPVKWDAAGVKAAQYKAEDMAKNDYHAHVSPEGVGPGDLAARFGARYLGENIAAGYGGGIYATDGWISSSGHRKNILNSTVTGMGVGAAYNSESEYTRYYAMMLTY